MSAGDVLLLVGGGFAAGILNTVAGGGSLLTVPLLILAGVPGNVANGSNRVGILTSNVSAVVAFRQLGISDVSKTSKVLIPVAGGALVGALIVGQLADAAFERTFGVVMVPLLLLSLRPPRTPSAGGGAWSPIFAAVVFFAVGVYGGAFQAGIGIILLLALSRSGMNLVLANSVKVVVILVLTIVALPVFILTGQVDWAPALVLAGGLTVGGAVGAKLTVLGGSGLIRGIMAAAVLALAARLIGLY